VALALAGPKAIIIIKNVHANYPNQPPALAVVLEPQPQTR
jgi:hypothetical protein